MIEYINATDARKITKESLERIQTEFLDEIMPEIKSQAAQGKSSIHWYYEISNAGLDALRNFGYKVEDFYNQKDGYTYKISW